MNVIRATYQSRVTAQKYVDGVPVFREEAINRWTDGELVAYFATEATLQECFDSWNEVRPWQYRVLRTERVMEATLPHKTLVHVRHNDYYLTERRHAFAA